MRNAGIETWKPKLSSKKMKAFDRVQIKKVHGKEEMVLFNGYLIWNHKCRKKKNQNNERKISWK